MNGRPLADRMKGRWKDALRALGVDERFLVNRNGPCPLCGGTDRYRFDDKEGRGTWFCSQCGGPNRNGGAGNGIDLFMRISDADFKDTALRLEAIYPDLREEAPKPTRSADDCQAAMRKLWAAGKPLDGQDAASRYLTARVGLWPQNPYLRFAALARYSSADDIRPSEHPALLAKVVSSTNAWVNLHRTYLTPAGGKAPVSQPKKAMMGELPEGCAIRLAPPGPVLAIAEGIETALACTALWGVPCWSAISAGLLERWTPPQGVERVIVAGDCDATFVGQEAAYTLARRLVKLGLQVEVRIPDAGDWCDVLTGSATGAYDLTASILAQTEAA